MGTVLSDVTELTDTGLTFGQSYSYRVAAFTSVNTSTWATIVSATEFPAPTNLAATTISDSEVELSWSDNCSFEDGYRIERNSGAGFIQAAELPPNVTEYIDTGLIGNLDYNYRVAAYTVTNTSAFCPTATVSTYGTMVDQEGNTYFTIQIGNQEWMAENLKVTHFRDGTAITNVSDDAAWAALTTEAYCIYNNNASDEIDTYGALYNWYAAADSRNIAPEGWHVPTDAEWKELEMALGMSQNDADDISYRGTNEGIKLSGNSALWDYGALEFDPEFGSSSFTALPGGYRYYLTGYYYKMGFSGYFWSATEDDITDAWYRQLDHSHLNVFRYNLGKTSGYSIRCLKD